MEQLTNSCYLCNSEKNSKNNIDYIDRFNHSLFKNKSISVCKYCGFGQIIPKINNIDLQHYYEEVYRSKSSLSYINFNQIFLDDSIIDYRSISQLLLGKQYCSNKKKYHFLDIGAGDGKSFISARKIFKNISLSAIESNNEAKEFYQRYLNDIIVYNSLVEVKEKVDILLMSHSLEHFDIDDMQTLFQDIQYALSDDGILIIEVPNADLRDSNILNRFNDTPHVSFFSLDSLSKLANKFDFELCFINTVGTLLTESNSVQTNTKKEQLIKKTPNLIEVTKQVIKAFGLYKYSLKFYNFFYHSHSQFYNDINFKYGGNRNLIRCVLKKK